MQKKLSSADKKKLAKMGLCASLGMLVLTSIVKNSKPLHVASGIAMVGFSLWHHSLYKNKKSTFHDKIE